MATAAQLEKNPQTAPGAVPATMGTSPGGKGQGFGGQAASRIGGQIQERWAGMQPRQRTWAMAGAALTAIVVASLLWYATRTDWRVLYAGLDPDDARQMAMVLTAAQIPYEVTQNGAGLSVPAGQLDKARLATAAKGGPRSGRLGFELFDKPNWVGSEFDEQVNYQRALEGELEHTVASLADVQSARVHLVLPHESLFRDADRPAKASVVIKPRHRSLADGEDESIRNLVASAVDGLTPDRVVLVDADGHMPLGPRTPEALRASEEEALEAKLIETLEPVTGAGNVRASVTVDYVDAATDETEETYDPDQTATLSVQRSELTTGPQPIAAGVPGTASNAPNSQALPVYPQQTAAGQSQKTEASTYGVSKTVRHSTEAPGKIRRLTAAIVVNDRLAAAGGKNQAASWQPRNAAELRNLTALAQAAVGFDAARGDLVTVEDLPFDQNRASAAAPVYERILQLAESSPVVVKYLALLLGLFVLAVFGIRPAFVRSRQEAARGGKKGKAGLPELPAAESAAPALGLPEVAEDPDRTRAQLVFDQVSETVRREPTQSSRLLQSWIHSD